jgi:hypothetical protein
MEGCSPAEALILQLEKMLADAKASKDAVLDFDKIPEEGADNPIPTGKELRNVVTLEELGDA